MLLYLYLKLFKFFMFTFFLCFFCSFFLKVSDLKIENKYLNNQIYTLFDYSKDLNFIRLNYDKYYYLLFIIMFIIFTIVRPFYMLCVFYCFVYYTLKIILYIFEEDPSMDIKLYRYHYFSKNYLTFFSLVDYFLKSSRFTGWSLAYIFIKLAYTKEFRKNNILFIFNNLSFILLFGINWSSFMFIHKTVLDSLDVSKGGNLYNLIKRVPYIIIFNGDNVFNKFLLMSKQLRIYKKNGRLCFNMKTLKHDIVKTSLNSKSSIAITSYSKNGKSTTHPGTADIDYEKRCKTFDTSYQWTGKTLENHKFVTFESINYKYQTQKCVYNIYRHHENIVENRYRDLLNKIGIHDYKSYIKFQNLMLMHRALEKNIPIIYEHSSGCDVIVNQPSMSEFIIKDNNRILFDINTIKYNEKILNNIENLTKKDFDAMSTIWVERPIIYSMQNCGILIDSDYGNFMQEKLFSNIYF